MLRQSSIHVDVGAASLEDGRKKKLLWESSFIAGKKTIRQVVRTTNAVCSLDKHLPIQLLYWQSRFPTRFSRLAVYIGLRLAEPSIEVGTLGSLLACFKICREF